MNEEEIFVLNSNIEKLCLLLIANIDVFSVKRKGSGLKEWLDAVNESIKKSVLSMRKNNNEKIKERVKKNKEDGCYICDVPDCNNKTVLENFSKYQYAETKDGIAIKQTYNYCPNCGRKIKKGE